MCIYSFIDTDVLRLALLQVLSATGGFLNTARIPERWLPVKHGKPGLFDYFFNSHQLMHILVVIAMACLYMGATLDQYESGAHCPV